MKRLIVCSDGTWQQLRSPYPTNVVKIAQAITNNGEDGISQIIFYDEGLGTGDWRDRLKGGAFGIGLDRNIQDAYRFLCWNYDAGDEIYLFGFSRGAYTVRSLGGLIARFGLLRRKHIRLTPQAYGYYRIQSADRNYAEKQAAAEKFRDTYGHPVAITLLGCWDTVGSLGIPDQIPLLPIDRWVNRKYQFHNTILSPTIQHALHAVAIDEIRATFNVTPMERSAVDDQPLKQVWFPGDHGCVGGGLEATRGLSDRALSWMMEETRNLGLGLTFNVANIPTGIKVQSDIAFDNCPRGIFRFGRCLQRPVSQDFHDIDNSVIERYRTCADYRPGNLAIHSQQLNRLCIA